MPRYNVFSNFFLKKREPQLKMMVVSDKKVRFGDPNWKIFEIMTFSPGIALHFTEVLGTMLCRRTVDLEHTQQLGVIKSPGRQKKVFILVKVYNFSSMNPSELRDDNQPFQRITRKTGTLYE